MIINEVNTEDLVKFEKILEIIKDQFQAVIQTDTNYYGNYNFEISNEQYYVPDEDRQDHKIYIVVKFLPAEIDYGQDVIPLTIQATSECNGIVAAQRLMLEYAQIFNLNTLVKDGKTIYQNYTSPNVISNFEIVYDGYRSLLVMSGTFLISSNINRIKLLYFDGADLSKAEEPGETKTTDLIECGETVYKWDVSQNKYVVYAGDEIDIINYTDTFDATPDTQPYFKNQNFTESIIKFGTFSFNVVSFLTRSNFNDKILKICSRKLGVNINFYFKISFDNGIDMPLLAYKLLNVTKQQNVGEMPTIVTAFTN